MQNQTIPKIKLTYFNMKARAEPVRLILSIGGIPFEDQRLAQDEFKKQQEAGAFKYNQLPVLEVDGKQFAQSAALVRYASALSGLLPQDPVQLLRAEQIYGNFQEIIDKLLPTFFLKGEEQEKARKALVDDVFHKWYKAIEAEIIDNGSTGYSVGNSLSFADIYLYTYLEWYESGLLDHIPTGLIKQYPNIQQVYKNVETHPKVQEWNNKNNKK